MKNAEAARHAAEHVVGTYGFPLRQPGGDLIRVESRRWFLQTGLAGLAGVSVPSLLRHHAHAAGEGRAKRKTSVILFWLSGGPSHLDMWDPKPDAPREVRGPFESIPTKVPGVRISEHLPLQAGIMDKLTILRAVDASASGHTPITFQAGTPLATRDNEGAGYPSMGSVAAKFRGPNHPGMPAFVGLADTWRSDVYGAGHLGGAHEPVNGKEVAGRFSLPQGVNVPRLHDRRELLGQLDRLRRDLEASDEVGRMDRFAHQAFDMVLSGRAARAFDLGEESEKTRDAYGRYSLGEKALLARRLVEAGVTFVLVSAAWGYWDVHGDHVQWGGIQKGLRPILPTLDRTTFALITDLETRGLLDSTLVLMLGEFGRTPVINKDGGRDHWEKVMSMLIAGGGLRHGQVIGSTDRKGYDIATRRVSPSDLAATVYHHLGIDVDAQWVNPQGRPLPVVTEGGQPIRELL